LTCAAVVADLFQGQRWMYWVDERPGDVGGTVQIKCGQCGGERMRFSPGGVVECVRCAKDRPSGWRALGEIALVVLFVLSKSPKRRRRKSAASWVAGGGDSPVLNRIERR
jgi:ribosomal protein S27E